MWAVSVREPNHLSLLQTEPPAPEPQEVVVRIGRAGICGSDMHIYRGHNPFARYPRVIRIGQVIRGLDNSMPMVRHCRPHCQTQSAALPHYGAALPSS